MSHPTSCSDPRCDLSYRDHFVGISIAAAAMPSRRPEAQRINAKEARWHQDHDAYVRLRRDGLQPPKIDGSRDRERFARTAAEVEGRPE